MKPKRPGGFAPYFLLLAIHTVASAEPQQGNVVLSNDDFTLTERSILEIKKPGYLNLATDPQSHAPYLMVSSFQAFGSDSLFSIKHWNKGLSEPKFLDTDLVSGQITWPNEARMVTHFSTFQSAGILVAGGFLVPGKATGAITFVPWNNPENQFAITAPKKGWYYHRTEEWDVNGDGLNDIITARGTMPMMGKPDGELLWLENPGTNDAKSIWKEHFIAKGPDVHFRVVNQTPTHMPLTIIATEFSGRKLTAFRQNSSGKFDSQLLDDTLGAAFDIQIVDLNGDGRRDLLVTNHEPDAKASVYGYEFDAKELRVLKRHTLLTGIETRQGGIKQASPGTIQAFQPALQQSLATQKPWILVSGDGSQRAHLLVPENDSNSQNWGYHEHEIWNAKSSVGKSEVGDLDGDGILELMIPAYDADRIGIFSLTPKKSPRSGN